MAAITRRSLSYLFKNFADTLAIQATNFHKTRQALFHCSSLLFGNMGFKILTEVVPVNPVHKRRTKRNGNEQGIKMPSLSPTMTEGKILKWLKKEGDNINPGDVLCDIETDKAVISMETEEEGILAKILIPENTSNIKVGSLIAVMVPPGEDWKNVEIPKEQNEPISVADGPVKLSEESKSEGGEKTKTAVASESSTIPITMPSLSPTMTAGTIVKWLKKEGDAVAPGDVLCDIQTDKAIMSLEAEEEGILAKIIVPADSKDIKVGTLIAVIVPEGEDWKNVTVSTALSTGKKEESQSQVISSSANLANEIRRKSFGPAVKALLINYQLEPSLIKPTGRGNRILKEDVLQYIADNKLERKPPAVSVPGKSDERSPPVGALPKQPLHATDGPKYKDIEITNVRRVIARRLIQAKEEIPHSYCMAKCDVDLLLDIREDLRNSGITVSVNDLLTKATALALQMCPKVNSTFINNELRSSKTVDICMAVATERGLFTPIIKSAGNRTVEDISKSIRELATRAREGKLKPEEYQGGTFTISNLGMFGVTHFKAVINPPQCGILAIGRTIDSLNTDMTIKKQIRLTLSSDSRVLSGHEAAEFMMILKYFIESPRLIILDLIPSLNARL